MAKKAETIFFCSECGYETPRWLGRCPGCQAWNTLVESRTVTGNSPAKQGGQRGWLMHETNSQARTSDPRPQDLVHVSTDTIQRISSGLTEFDRVLGGGFVPGSLVLVGGDPGIGKSTLLLQVCAKSKFKSGPVLYICGEESPSQVKLRAARLDVVNAPIKLYPEIIFERIARVILKLKPDLVVVDSIQTMYSEELTSAPGSVSQIREVTAGFLRLAKHLNCTIVLVGHVTKDGAIAGPRVLEHMVDTVLYFEGESHSSLRMIRGFKNRFGATNELGIFEMTGTGLKTVENASLAMIAGRPQGVPGSAITACLEGTRPLLLEVQVLLNDTAYGMPQRMAQGLDRGRISMLMAVLEKHVGLNFGNMDAFCNVVGGLRIDDPAADLAIAAAMTSSYRDVPVKNQALLIGEIGLTGELRPVSAISQRIGEAGRLGFTGCILPGSCRRQGEQMSGKAIPELLYADTLTEALDMAFQ
ncbi:MAG TPA: DNA repair protein RadA [Clostridiaceae bacterium]|nr:DNA repair protein RadA [Clostridiaceae bacterium]